jgi:hypothetical protein
MGTAKVFRFVATTAGAGLLLLGIGTLSAKPDGSNPHKPVPATDVVLVPKISFRGGPPHAVARRKKPAGAATGFLAEPCHGTRYAIVAGISDYPGLWNDLDYADLDALDMATALEVTYGFPVDNILLLTNRQATAANILAAIDVVRAEAGADDEVVFFFSGHGMSGVAADGDHERRDEAIVTYSPLRLEPLWDGELREAFRDCLTSRIVFIFDVCMAGGMDDLQAPGRVILMAATERGYAYEGDEWGHGEFTYYLLEGILTGAANVQEYGFNVLSEPALVTAEQAFDYAKANCVWDTPVVDDSFPDDLLP